MHIICEKIDSTFWTAWMTNEPDASFVGVSPQAAIRKLLVARPEINAETLALDDRRSRDGRLYFLVGDLCQDCNGSGKYVGLLKIENCRTCGGTGRLDNSIPF